jgi:uncharacterized protein YcbX
MLGEELDAADLTEGGIVGDRAYAIRDRETGKVASAKHSKRWPNLLDCRAAFVEPPGPGDELPQVRIELADGNSVLSDAADVDAVLSRFFGRDVELARAAQNGYTIDQYHPDLESYDPDGHRDEVVEAQLGAAFFSERGLPSAVPEASFFDLYPLSVLTTSTLDQLGNLEPQSRFDVRRFRLNVIVDTPRVDSWRTDGSVARSPSATTYSSPCPCQILVAACRAFRRRTFRGTPSPQGPRPPQQDRRRGCALPLRRGPRRRAGVYAVAEATGTVRKDDSVSLA